MTPRETYPPGVTLLHRHRARGRRRRGRVLRRPVRLVVRGRDAAGRAAVRDGPARRADRGRDRRAVRGRVRRRRGTRTSTSRRGRDRGQGRGRGRRRRGGAVRRRRRRAGWPSSPTRRARSSASGRPGARTASSSSTPRARGTGATSRRATSTPRRRSTARSSAGSTSEVDLGQGPSAMIRVPGYGDHLESLDPRHARGPQGARRARGLLRRDRLDAAARDPRRRRPLGRHLLGRRRRRHRRAAPPALGGTVLVEPFDVPYVRMAVIRDPDGVTFAIGQFQPPE